jgi:uncharacterized membrane protein
MPIIIGGIAAAIFFLIRHSIRTGEAQVRGRTVVREDDPIMFWVIQVFSGTFGVGLALLAVVGALFGRWGFN